MQRATAVGKEKSQTSLRAFGGHYRWLYLLFFLSGISGLMYEVVWVRMLTRVLGSTVYATSTVLAAFMAGLALGSFLSGRFVDRAVRPLRWYALLELGIGLAALYSLALPDQLLPLYRKIYEWAGGVRAILTAGQVVVAMIVLLVPTALMGATLPTLCAYGARRHADFGRCVGVLYGLNSLGALVGVLASGFVLIGELGETLTVVVGVVLNLLVAGAAYWLSLAAQEAANHATTSQPLRDAVGEDNPAPIYSAGVHRALLACFAVSGFAALANEVVWSRMLLLKQDTSIYAFTGMLAAVLAGMGAGSYLGAWWVRTLRDPLRQMAWLQLAAGLAVGVSLHLFVGITPHMLLAPLILLGPLGLLWGLAFPVGAACFSHSQTPSGRSIADLYSWNTLGCIAGSLAAGFLLIPWLGASRSAACLAGVNLVLGILLLWVHPRGLWSVKWLPEWGLAATAAVLLALAGDPYFQVIKKNMQAWFPRKELLINRHIEEAGATTTSFGTADGDFRNKHLWVNGYGMTTLLTVTKLFAHLPLALVDNPRDILVICFGMGTTTRSANTHEGLQIQVVELLPSVVECLPFYHADGPELLKKPNIHVTVDDGRNYLLMHPQLYDVITIDPPPPVYSAGAVNLLTREFFQLCKERLKPDGVLFLWTPPVLPSENKLIAAAFLAAFENVNVWLGPPPNQGMILVGSIKPLTKIPEKIQKLYTNKAAVADLTEWGPEVDSPKKVIDLYAGGRDQLMQFVGDSPMNTDDTPYTEFPLWRSIKAAREAKRK